MKTPDHMPEKGFYYHYKHDPNGLINNYAYEIMGAALHTEDKTETVVYRPLYKNTYLKGFDYSIRPLEMFLENVTRDDKTLPRFQKITDLAVISALKKIRTEMYGG